MKQSRFKVCSFQIAWLALTFGFALSGGCGDARRQSIEGTVTFDGQPIADGYIRFIPQGNTHGPTAGANIKDGRFSIDPDKGTFVGTFRVEILATRQTGRSIVDPVTDERVSARQQYIPAKYNTESELTTEIKDGQPNELEFKLASK